VKTKSERLQTIITDTLKLWRRHHLTYDQTRYVAKEVRRALAIARPPTRQRVIARLSRAEEERLIAQAYRMPGARGLLIKTLFQSCQTSRTSSGPIYGIARRGHSLKRGATRPIPHGVFSN
jgi:integrase/recombinase XerD